VVDGATDGVVVDGIALGEIVQILPVDPKKISVGEVMTVPIQYTQLSLVRVAKALDPIQISLL
jgi:hypothetical protein